MQLDLYFIDYLPHVGEIIFRVKTISIKKWKYLQIYSAEECHI